MQGKFVNGSGVTKAAFYPVRCTQARWEEKLVFYHGLTTAAAQHDYVCSAERDYGRSARELEHQKVA